MWEIYCCAGEPLLPHKIWKPVDAMQSQPTSCDARCGNENF